jgi:predicted nucleic acid-binding protein
VVVAAIVSAIVSIAVLVVSTWTARALHTEKLDSERKLAERRFEYDKDSAERKFRYERDLHDHGRRIELAEQAIAAIHEAKGTLSFALKHNPTKVPRFLSSPRSSVIP